MRLIDADAFDRALADHEFSAALNEAADKDGPFEDIPMYYSTQSFRDVMKYRPTIDAVPVVRCKDCKYSDVFSDDTTYEMPLKCLNIRYGGVQPWWYCEHGERRDSDD